jgi:hypothetical protein
MANEKSDIAKSLDGLQAKLRPVLKDYGFRARGRTFNRTTSDGLTQVVNLQMGRFDPPGTTYVPGLRDNLYGKFTVNLGAFVPEVASTLAERHQNRSFLNIVAAFVLGLGVLVRKAKTIGGRSRTANLALRIFCNA